MEPTCIVVLFVFILYHRRSQAFEREEEAGVRIMPPDYRGEEAHEFTICALYVPTFRHLASYGLVIDLSFRITFLASVDISAMPL